MKRINDVEESIWLLDNHIVPADQYKLRMGYRVLLAVRCANDKWPGTSEVVSNKFAIHK